MTGATAALVTSVVGIVVSGVVGPQFTGWATRSANSRQFALGERAKQRDDLRGLLDDAAVLLAAGATNLRLLSSTREQQHDLESWVREVFPVGQRLRLRLPGDHPVVTAYDGVRRALEGIASAPSDRVEEPLVEFESARSAFLDEARTALESYVETSRLR